MRLDIYLYENGYAKSRSYASELIKKGFVTVNGKKITKCSYEVLSECSNIIEITSQLFPFVGRGGVKLDYALDFFDLDIDGFSAVDVGASTGGFTDCLLKRGAKRVYAVDSGHYQLDISLRNDKRVVNLEGFNARNLDVKSLGELCDIAVCDISFISQTLIVKQIASVIKDKGLFVTLIKPQFECGKDAVGKGGIVKDREMHKYACKKVISSAEENKLFLQGIVPSPIKGGDGNIEFLGYFVKNGISVLNDKIIDEVINGEKLCNSSDKS